MRKTGKRIKHWRSTSPMLTATYLAPVVSGRDRVAVMAFSNGFATAEHFNVLLETQQMLVFAATKKRDEEALKVGQFGNMALQSIHHRYERTKKFGTTGEESKALRLLVDYADDWWKRQSGGTFTEAFAAVDNLWGIVRKKAA